MQADRREGSRRILLVGATGVFGRRLARQLATIKDASLIVASRDAGRAEALAAQLRLEAANPQTEAVAFDKPADLIRLKALAPWLVIDASGPFQKTDYSLARASLEAGAHYIDLADARSHVLGFHDALDRLARERGLIALTGASSTPALSGAAVEAMTACWRRIDAIESAITPGGASDVGPSVIEAILTYAGRPIPVWRNAAPRQCCRLGRCRAAGDAGPRTKVGLAGRNARRRTVSSPIRRSRPGPLSRRTGVRRIEHFGLLALARALHGVPRPKTMARLLHAVRRFTRPFCGDKGAMIVRVSGIDSTGALIRAQWSLLAENDDGPNVPTLAAVASARALLAGKVESGARPCVGVVALAEIEREMSNFAITTRMRVATACSENEAGWSG